MTKLSTSGEHSVAVFFEDGTNQYVSRWIGPKEAVETFKASLEGAGPNVTRVIITDGLDFTNAEWVRGKGVTFPAEGV